MDLLRITAPHPYLGLIQQWYEEAFPLEERRDFSNLVALLPHPAMHLCVLRHEQEPVGFIIYWHWANDGVLFIEHLAIDPTRRGQQLGQQALAPVLTLPAKYTLLETEPSSPVGVRHKLMLHPYGAGKDQPMRFYYQHCVPTGLRSWAYFFIRKP